MSRGPSGRIVVEIEPQLKHGLYTELARNGLTLKDWLVGHAKRYIEEESQPSVHVRRAASPASKQTRR